MTYWPVAFVIAPASEPPIVTCTASIGRRVAESTTVPRTTPVPCASAAVAGSVASRLAATTHIDHVCRFIHDSSAVHGSLCGHGRREPKRRPYCAPRDEPRTVGGVPTRIETRGVESATIYRGPAGSIWGRTGPFRSFGRGARRSGAVIWRKKIASD